MAKLSKWQLGCVLLLAGGLGLTPLSGLKGMALDRTDTTSALAASPVVNDADALAGASAGEAGQVAAASRMVAPVNGMMSGSAPTSVINPSKEGSLVGQGSDPLGLASKNFLSGKVDPKILKGSVSKGESPFVEGQVQTVPKGTKVDLTMMHVVNSELTQKGDEIWMKVARDVVGGNGRVMPGTWYMHGLVTEAQGAKRGNRDGYVEIQFDKIVSPDGKYEADFKATLSTKDSTMKSVAKQVFTESRYTAVGALGGALISLQVTGIGGAIATHGISVGAGAAVGGTLGLIGWLKKYGDVASISSGDNMKLTIVEPLEMPVFKEQAFQSDKPAPKLTNMDIRVNNYAFAKDPFGDKHSKRLQVDVTIVNHTNHNVKASQLSVVNDFEKQFTPVVDMNLRDLMRPIQPFASERILIVYEVDDAKHKYWLSLHDNTGTRELTRIPVNCQ